MTRLYAFLIAIFALFALPALAAEEHASVDEAKAMAERAAAFVAENPDADLQAVFGPDGDPQWHDRDLYVTVTARSGELLVHGTKPAVVGKQMIDLRDVNGKPFVQETVAIEDRDWVSFKWQTPDGSAILDKTAYTIRVGDLFVAVVAYNGQ